MKRNLFILFSLVILLFSCSLDSSITKNAQENIITNDNTDRGIGAGAVTAIPLGYGMCDVDYSFCVIFDQLTYSSVTISWSDGYTQYDNISLNPASSCVYGSVQRRGITPGRYRVSLSGYAYGFDGSYTITQLWSKYVTVR